MFMGIFTVHSKLYFSQTILLYLLKRQLRPLRQLSIYQKFDCSQVILNILLFAKIVLFIENFTDHKKFSHSQEISLFPGNFTVHRKFFSSRKILLFAGNLLFSQEVLLFTKRFSVHRIFFFSQEILLVTENFTVRT